MNFNWKKWNGSHEKADLTRSVPLFLFVLLMPCLLSHAGEYTYPGYSEAPPSAFYKLPPNLQHPEMLRLIENGQAVLLQDDATGELAQYHGGPGNRHGAKGAKFFYVLAKEKFGLQRQCGKDTGRFCSFKDKGITVRGLFMRFMNAVDTEWNDLKKVQNVRIQNGNLLGYAEVGRGIQNGIIYPGGGIQLEILDNSVVWAGDGTDRRYRKLETIIQDGDGPEFGAPHLLPPNRYDLAYQSAQRRALAWATSRGVTAGKVAVGTFFADEIFGITALSQAAMVNPALAYGLTVAAPAVCATAAVMLPIGLAASNFLDYQAEQAMQPRWLKSLDKKGWVPANDSARGVLPPPPTSDMIMRRLMDGAKP